MIWLSKLAMAFSDITILLMIAIFARQVWVNRGLIAKTGLNKSVYAFAFAISIPTAFYLSDLVIMFLLPLLVPESLAMRIMTYLQLNVAWVAAAVALAFFTYGFSALLHTLLNRFSLITKDFNEEQMAGGSVETALRGRYQYEKALLETKLRLENILSNIPAVQYRLIQAKNGEVYFDYIDKGKIGNTGIEGADVFKDNELFSLVHPEAREIFSLVHPDDREAFFPLC